MMIHEKRLRLLHFTAVYVVTHGHSVYNEARKLQYIITLQLWKFFFVFFQSIFFRGKNSLFIRISVTWRECKLFYECCYSFTRVFKRTTS